MNKNFIPIAILIVGILIAGVAFFANKSGGDQDVSEVMSIEEAGTKVIDFINNELLKGQATAILGETSEENGLYKIKFNINGQDIESYLTKDGNLFFPEAIKLNEFSSEPAVEQGFTIGDFSVSSDELCTENGKPIVYFFGSETCPYCQWEHPVIKKVVEKFGAEIVYHDNMDNDADSEIFAKYSTGGIPTLVMGCRYFRVGAGQEAGEEAETNNLTALTCKLTGNKPEGVCSEVQDLIDQITN
ncbi:MAG: thioredoxin family protein [Candidatus Nealsonbacteria bacterium]